MGTDIKILGRLIFVPIFNANYYTTNYYNFKYNNLLYNIIKRIDNKLKKIEFNENELKRKKKVLISNEVFSYENIEMINA